MAEYEPGELPPDFHKRVVDLEIKIEMHGVKQDKDNEGQIKLLSDLMQLYSAAIEHYNRQRDEENYTYYIAKLQSLNEDIRTLIEREERQLGRIKTRKEAKKAAKKADATQPTEENKMKQSVSEGYNPLRPSTTG